MLLLFPQAQRPGISAACPKCGAACGCSLCWGEMMKTVSLARYDAARHALQAAHSVDEVKDIRDKAQAMAAYARQAKDTELLEWATEIKVRAERRAGEMLRDMAERGERATKGNPQMSHAATFGPTLDVLGINRSQSSRWQKLAAVPEDKFEQAVAAAKEIAGAVTTAALLRLGRDGAQAQREAQRSANATLVEGVAPPSLGTYATIVIDPPWDWGDEGDENQFGRARPLYQTMPLEEILALPISELAATNAHLYLWITNRSLPKGFMLLEKWGFRYITTLTWCKPSFGMGNYFRGSTEHVLFGVKGSLPLLRHDIGTWFQAPRKGQHSAKPQEFFEMVEKASPGPWLEMFARNKRSGWVTWGAEV